MLKHGIDQPIVVDEDGVIIKGHGRRLAALDAGFDEFPVVVHRGLSEDEKRSVRIADNQVALLSGWNVELLASELGQLNAAGFDMTLVGFSNAQLATYLAPRALGDPEETPPLPKVPISRAGDLWELDRHRLLCGDSTKQADVARALGAHKPNLMVTDPPYGVDYDPAWRNRVRRLNGSFVAARAVGEVHNDDRADWSGAWKLFPGDVAYVWHGGLHVAEAERSLTSSGFAIRAQIIWDKQRLVIGRGDYHWQHEPCWYAVRKGKPGGWRGDRSQTSIWSVPKPQASETGHSTQKPVECMRRPIENSSVAGSYVYEPFCGSGTTIIAAQLMARYCLAIELAPDYIDVAVQRWQTFTKLEARLAGDGRTFAEVSAARKRKPPQPKPGRPVAASISSG